MSVALPRRTRIGVIRTDKIGDLLVSTPALRALREALPAADITLVTGRDTAGLLEGWDAIERVAVFEGHDARHTLAELRAARFDATLCLTPTTAAYRLAWRLGAPVSVGFGYRARPLQAVAARFAFTHRVLSRVPEAPSAASQVPHHAQEMLDCVAALGLPAPVRPMEVPLDDASLDWARAACAQRPVLVQLSHKWLADGWTGRDVAALVAALETALGRPVVAAAGPADAAVRGALAGIIDPPTLGHWAALTARAAVVVSPDSAGLHLASATRRPVVGLYAPRRFDVLSRQWAPWQVPHRIVMKAAPAAVIPAVVSAVRELLG